MKKGRRFDWTDIVLWGGIVIPLVVGASLQILGEIWQWDFQIGLYFMGMATGFWLGSALMRQFMLRWMKKLPGIKIEGKKGDEVIKYSYNLPQSLPDVNRQM